MGDKKNISLKCPVDGIRDSVYLLISHNKLRAELMALALRIWITDSNETGAISKAIDLILSKYIIAEREK